jgi:hypothetical protein
LLIVAKVHVRGYEIDKQGRTWPDSLEDRAKPPQNLSGPSGNVPIGSSRHHIGNNCRGLCNVEQNNGEQSIRYGKIFVQRGCSIELFNSQLMFAKSGID